MAQHERSDSTEFPSMAIPVNVLTAMHGVANSMLTGNMEVAGLIGQRTRAQMELSKQVMACRTPSEVGQLGAQFWRGAFHDYVQFNQRVMAVWMQGMTAAGQSGMAGQIPETAAEPFAWWLTDMTDLKTQPNGRAPAGP